MNIDALLNTPCTITGVAEDPEDPDEYGNPRTTETATTTVCWLHQTDRSDTTGLDDIQAETWTVYLPAGTEIDGTDVLTVAGVDYELHGPPWAATHPRTGNTEFVIATVKRAV